MKRTLPLANKRILITRSNEQATYFSTRIQALGGTSLEVPLIQFELPQNLEEIKADIDSSIRHFDWIVFTSINGVKFFFDLHKRPLTNAIATVGKKTKQALTDRGYCPELTPSKYSAEDLIEEFKKGAPANGSSVLLIQGNLARPILREELLKIGYNVKQIIVYENHPIVPEEKDIQQVLAEGMDVVTFTSPSTVHNFLKVFGKQDVPVAVIGPITKRAAEKAGITVDICPEEYTVDGLLAAIVQFFQKEDT